MTVCRLSADEIAAYLGVNPDTIYKGIRPEEHARATCHFAVMNLILHGTEAIRHSTYPWPPSRSPHQVALQPPRLIVQGRQRALAVRHSAQVKSEVRVGDNTSSTASHFMETSMSPNVELN